MFVLNVSGLNRGVCWAMVTFVPVSLVAADSGSAILHSQGVVWVNGNEAHDSTAILPGDLLETKSGSVASLDADGSSILIQPETVVKFNGDSLTLEHGSVSVGTSTSMSVHVECIRILPASNGRTQYDATDVSGTILVVARKLDVNIFYGASTRKPASARAASQLATVHEGQQVAREEACGTAKKPGAAATSINTKWIGIGGTAGGAAAILCALLCGGESPPSVSPWKP